MQFVRCRRQREPILLLVLIGFPRIAWRELYLWATCRSTMSEMKQRCRANWTAAADRANDSVRGRHTGARWCSVPDREVGIHVVQCFRTTAHTNKQATESGAEDRLLGSVPLI